MGLAWLHVLFSLRVSEAHYTLPCFMDAGTWRRGQHAGATACDVERSAAACCSHANSCSCLHDMTGPLPEAAQWRRRQWRWFKQPGWHDRTIVSELGLACVALHSSLGPWRGRSAVIPLSCVTAHHCVIGVWGGWPGSERYMHDMLPAWSYGRLLAAASPSADSPRFQL